MLICRCCDLNIISSRWRHKRVCWTFSLKSLAYQVLEAVVHRYSVKNVFLEIWYNWQENICARVSFLIKLQASGLHWHTCFPVNFVQLLRTPFYIEHLWWLLLKFISYTPREIEDIDFLNSHLTSRWPLNQRVTFGGLLH